MKFQALLASAFIWAVSASPVPELVARQSSESDELQNGPCRAVTFIFARGSTETGNMVCNCISSFIYFLELNLNRELSWAPPPALLSSHSLAQTMLRARVLAHHTMLLLRTTSCRKTPAPKTLAPQQPCSSWQIPSAPIPKSSQAATGKFLKLLIT
jgi:hypothetical protein